MKASKSKVTKGKNLGWRLGLGAVDYKWVFSSRSVAVGSSRSADMQRQIADGWTRSGGD